MTIKKNIYCFVIGLVLCVALKTSAQVLSTAETIGKNNQSVFATESHSFVDGIDFNIASVQYIRGLTDRFDIYAIAGETNILNEDQAWVGVGGNFHLVQIATIDVSSFNIVSMPLNKSDMACTLLLNSALITSRNFGNFSLYTGVNALVPIGARERGFFTPIEYELNVPVGVFIPWRQFGLFIEGDYGHLKSVGVGLAYNF